MPYCVQPWRSAYLAFAAFSCAALAQGRGLAASPATSQPDAPDVSQLQVVGGVGDGGAFTVIVRDLSAAYSLSYLSPVPGIPDFYAVKWDRRGLVIRDWQGHEAVIGSDPLPEAERYNPCSSASDRLCASTTWGRHPKMYCLLSQAATIPTACVTWIFANEGFREDFRDHCGVPREHLCATDEPAALCLASHLDQLDPVCRLIVSAASHRPDLPLPAL